MRKLAYIQKLGNGVMLTVKDESGCEVPFFVVDNGSIPSRTLTQVADAVGEGKQAIHFQKLGNGILFYASDDSNFFLPAEESDGFKDMERAFDAASAAAKEEAYREEPQAEQPNVNPASSFNWGHEDDYEYSDDPGVGEVGAYYARKVARFVNSSPEVGNFLGSILGGLNNAEAARDRMKKGKK